MPEDEEISVEGESEEVSAPEYVRDPGQPSKEEEEEHRMSHLPFRCWCRWCIQGRGLGMQHRRKEGRSTVPRVGMDYYFLTRGTLKKRSELEESKFRQTD